MKKTIKVPATQYRAATLKVEGEGDKRTVTMSISSDEPYLRFDYWNDEEYYEILSHAPGDINEERLKAGLPILFNHNRDDHLGRAGNYANDGHKCTVAQVSFSESDFAQAKFRDVVNGVLVDTSVGYTVDGEGEAVGVKDGKPVYKFKWTPFEGSLVTVPADISVGVGRQRGIEGEGEPREILIREKDDSQNNNPVDNNAKPGQKRENEDMKNKRGNFFFNKDDGGGSGGSGGGGGAPTPEQQTANRRAVSDGIKAARARETEIRAIAKRGNNVPDDEIQRAIDDAIENPAAVDTFRKLVFEKFWGNPTPAQTPGENDRRSTTGGGNVSGAMMIRTPGAIFLESEPFRALESGGKRRLARGQVVSAEIEGLSDFRTALQLAHRATLVSGTGSADVPNVQDLTTVVTTLQQRLTVADLCGAGATDKGSIRYPQQTAYVNTTGVVAEGAAKPEVTFRFLTKTATVSKIAGWTKVSDEVLEDFPFLKSVIDTQLPFMVQQREEDQLLNGDGTGEELEGLLNVEGLQTQAAGADVAVDAIHKAITKIRTLAFLEPDGIIIHPNDWQEIRLAKDANGQYYAGSPFGFIYGGAVAMVDRLWGLPVVVTTAMTEGTALVGAFKIATMIARRTGLVVEITNVDQDDFIKNLVTIRAEERLALLVWRPAGLCEVTGI